MWESENSGAEVVSWHVQSVARANVCEARWISRGRQCQSAEGGFVGGGVASCLGKVGIFKVIVTFCLALSL